MLHATHVGRVLLLLLLVPRSASGSDPVPAQLDARLLSANPDSPVSALFVRDQLHGKIGVPIPLFGEPEKLSLTLPALIELHNRYASFAPYQYWRGRLSIEGTARTLLEPGTVAGLSFLLEHESDHVSGSPGDFLNKNGFAFRLDLTWMLGDSALTVSSIPRVHLRTCTKTARVCGAGGGNEGSAGFEQTAEIIFDGGLRPREQGGLRYFISAAGSWMLPHRLVAEEKRAIVEAGLSTRRIGRGLLQLYLTGLAGNELGYLRRLDEMQLGAGFRWAP